MSLIGTRRNGRAACEGSNMTCVDERRSTPDTPPAEEPPPPTNPPKPPARVTTDIGALDREREAMRSVWYTSEASSSKKRSYSSGAAFYASQVQRQSFESSQSPSSRTATASVLSNHKQTNNAHSTLRHRSSIADEASPGTLDRTHSQQWFHPSVIQINRGSSFTY